MLTQDVTEQLQAVLEQLQQQGKEPTVALVRARMNTLVPMPALIAAIKSWKSAQRVPKVEVAASQTETDQAERIAQLEKTWPNWPRVLLSRGTTQHGDKRMKLWVDADACPKVIRETIVRAAERTALSAPLSPIMWCLYPKGKISTPFKFQLDLILLTMR